MHVGEPDIGPGEYFADMAAREAHFDANTAVVNSAKHVQRRNITDQQAAGFQE